MIKFCDGDLLEAEVEALVNAVNCVGIMGKGIALQFKHKFPANFLEYKQACIDGIVVPGQMFIVKIDDSSGIKYIINFPTKSHWRSNSRLEYIQAGLVTLTSEIRRLNISSIAIPKLGCGNGGLQWDSMVKPLIIDTFAPLDYITILIFE